MLSMPSHLLAICLLGCACASNTVTGRACYNTFNELITLLNGENNCRNQLPACSTDCSAVTSDGVQRYGCCVNVLADFENDMNPGSEVQDGFEDEFSELFFRCGTTRPPRCADSPFNAPPTLPPPSPRPPFPATLQSSAASHITIILPVASALLAVVFSQLQ